MFINANHLIQWLSKQPLRRCVLRALENGKVELLGGFKSIPPGSDPGFIVLVNSYPRNGCPGGRWVVAVVCRQNTNVYARVIPNIPWDQWDGKIDRHTIYDGATPELYAQYRDKARANPKI